MKNLILILILCTGCKTYYLKGCKIATPNGNFYTNEFIIKNDSIFIVEFNGDYIRRTGMFKISEVKINQNHHKK